MKAALAFVAVVAILSSGASARQLKQETSTGITDADILNFALNLEVSVGRSVSADA